MFGVQPQVLRYLLNGLAATLVHYSVLSLNLHLFDFRSAGVANLVAAVFGIGASFLGSYFYVFAGAGGPILSRLSRFVALYAAIAVLHGAVLWVWTDHYRADYRIGFVLATVLQMAFSFFGNKHLVFR